MKRKRSFIISGVLVVLAGFLVDYAWGTEENSLSVALMVLATVLFLTGAIIFVLNFKE
ncbi:hypothetical protein [Pedobacter hiemivivus]|jgi:hypothetical protein|uniref:hypothetical protein n=1 Tax=Pedobacter hiemivivus TaxID=2530454 RepID=UPI0013F1680F|nr:hypothetical protein [Pedobacter hiemivivus]